VKFVTVNYSMSLLFGNDVVISLYRLPIYKH